MSKETRKRTLEELIDQTIYDYTQIARQWEKRAEEQKRRITFIQGIVLGLVYGIIGNLTIQHWYPVFEGLVLERYDEVFYFNLVVFASALGVILLVTFLFARQLKDARRRELLAYEGVEVAQATMMKRIELLREWKKKEKAKTAKMKK